MHFSWMRKITDTTMRCGPPVILVISRTRRPRRLFSIEQIEVVMVVDDLAGERVVAKRLKAVIDEFQRKLVGCHALFWFGIGLGRHGGVASCHEQQCGGAEEGAEGGRPTGHGHSLLGRWWR